MLLIFKGVFRTGLYIVTVLTGVAYLLTCLIPYIDTGRYWFISFLGIAFIPVFIFLAILLLIWILLRSKMWMVCLIILLFGFQQMTTAFGFHFLSGFHLEKGQETLRIMQWNVHNWNQVFFEKDGNRFKKDQPEMMALVRKYNPDILCTEEFFESIDSEKFKSNIQTLKEMGYSYHYFNRGDLKDKYYYIGIAVFSKYPIVATGRFTEENYWQQNPLIFADIKISEQKIFRVFALHLQSVRFQENDYFNIQRMKNPIDPKLKGSRSIASKLRLGFRRRYEQSAVIKNMIGQSPYPVILCGDFNDVPNSGAYFNIRGNLQDAFLKKSSFIGRTFRFISPTLRIDYIMAAKNFDVKQFKVIKAPYSDHYPLVTDLKF